MTTLDEAAPEPVGSKGTPADRTPGAHWAWWGAFAFHCLGVVSIAADAPLHFNGSPIDGPFQLFNALRRLSAGQKFGATFQFFHGPGIAYIHLIPFYTFGGSFLASEMSRHLVSIVAALAVFAGFFR